MKKQKYTVEVITTENTVEDPELISRLIFGMSLDDLVDEVYNLLIKEAKETEQNSFQSKNVI